VLFRNEVLVLQSFFCVMEKVYQSFWHFVSRDTELYWKWSELFISAQEAGDRRSGRMVFNIL